MKPRDLVLRLCLATSLCVAAGSGLNAQTTTVFTNSISIGATNTGYDGEDIVVEGCVLTVNGSHAFNRLSLSNNATLTHQAAGSVQTYSLMLTITNNLVVDATSSINVSGRGYSPGYTVGNTNAGASGAYGGGS